MASGKLPPFSSHIRRITWRLRLNLTLLCLAPITYGAILCGDLAFNRIPPNP